MEDSNFEMENRFQRTERLNKFAENGKHRLPDHDSREEQNDESGPKSSPSRSPPPYAFLMLQRPTPDPNPCS